MAFKYNDEWKLYQKEQKLDNTYYQQQQAQLNKWNQESAQKQMDFQKMMSDTSHQREVQDLVKAGLNPVLSANNGASTPSGSYATIDSTPLSSASQSRMANRQMRQNMIQNKMQLANAMSIAKYQAQMQYAAQKYATDMSYQLGMAGLSNQLEIANLPYQDGNINQSTKYQVDADPNKAFTQFLLGLGTELTGTKDASSAGKALAALITGESRNNGRSFALTGRDIKSFPLTTAALDYIKNRVINKHFARQYNISKRDRLMSIHEFAKGNWKYNSEKWKRDQGYKFDHKDYK